MLAANGSAVENYPLSPPRARECALERMPSRWKRAWEAGETSVAGNPAAHRRSFVWGGIRGDAPVNMRNPGVHVALEMTRAK